MSVTLISQNTCIPVYFLTLFFIHHCPSHIETSQLICTAYQLTGFYMRGALVVKGSEKPLVQFQFFKNKSLAAVCRCPINRYFEKFQKINRKTSLLEYLFNKATGLRPATLLKKRLRQKCFPGKFAKVLKQPFLFNSLVST